MGDPFVSFQGVFDTAGAGHDFTIYAGSAGQITATTLHGGGGVNAGGETIPGGSFDPTLRLTGNGLDVFNDDANTGTLDSRVVATVPEPLGFYNLRLQAFASAGATGRWAVDVVKTGDTLYYTPSVSAGSRITRLTVGSPGGVGFADAYYQPTTGHDALADTTVTVAAGGALDLGLVEAGRVVRIGALAGGTTVRNIAEDGGNVILGNQSVLAIGGNNESTIFAGGISGDGGLVKTGTGRLTLANVNTFTGNIDVNGGSLEFYQDARLGGTNVAQVITVSNGAELRSTEFGSGGSSSHDPTISPNRRVVIGSGGGRLSGGMVFTEPGQLSASDPIAIEDGGISLENANPGLTGLVSIRGQFPSFIASGGVTATAEGALGSSLVVMDGGSLALTATRAMNNDVIANNARITYRAPDAAGGHTIRTTATLIPRTPVRFYGGSSVSINYSVDSVGQDRFQIGTNCSLEVTSSTVGVLTRGVNLDLAPGAVVAPLALDTIANLGTANDLFFAAHAFFEDVGVRELVVGRSGGTTPWRGISEGGQQKEFFGRLIAVDDFELQGIFNPLRLGRWGPVTVVADHPVTAFVTRGMVATQTGSTSDFHNVTFDVAPGAALIAQRDDGLHGATAVNVHHGGRLEFNAQFPDTIVEEIGLLAGDGDVVVGNGDVTLVVGRGGSSTFSGHITDRVAPYGSVFIELFSFGATTGNLTKVGPSTFTLAGVNDYRGLTTVAEGVLASGAVNALPDDSAFTVAAGAILDLRGFDDEVGSVAGGGSVALGGAKFTVGRDGSSTSFSGTVTDTGTLTKTGNGQLSLTRFSSFSGALKVTGGTLRLAGSLGGTWASTVEVGVGATVHLDSSTAAGGNSLYRNHLTDTTPITLAGGTLLVSGVDGGVTSEYLGTLSLQPGASTVRVAAGSGGTADVTFSSLGSRAPGATVNFVGTGLGTTTKVALGGQPAGFIGGWAVANGADFAKYDAAAGVVPFAAADYSTSLVNNAHVKLSAPVTANTRTIRTLSIAAASAPLTVTQSAGTTLTLSSGALLKTGGGAGAITGGNLTATTSDLVFYVGAGGDLDISSAVTGPIGVTKAGPGRMLFSGARANTYTGATYVNEGELFLSRSGAGTNAAVIGNVFVNGGTLRLGAADQIADAATVTLNAGQFRLEGHDERIKALVNQGGTFDAGDGKLDADTASISGGGQVILGLAPPAGLAASAAAAALPADDVRIVSTLGKASVESGRIRVLNSAELQVGAGGLSFVGGGTPEISLEGGHLKFTDPVEGGISVSGGTRASITGTGQIDLNGNRVFCETEGSELVLSTLVQGGRFEKAGLGLVRLSGSQASGTVTVSQGKLEVTDPLAITGSPLTLKGGTLALKFVQPSSGLTTLGTRIELAASSTLTAEDVVATSPSQPAPPPSRVALDSLTASAAGRLSVSSVNGVTVEFAGPTVLAATEIANDCPLVLSGAVTGAGGSLTKRGAGVLTLAGSASNTFGSAASPALTVAGGRVDLAKVPGGPGAPPLAVAGDVAIIAGGSVRLLAPEQVVDTAGVSLSGAGGAEAVLDLNGFTETVRSLSLAGAARVVTGGGALRVTGALGVGAGATVSVDDAGGAAAAAPGGTRAPFGGRALVVSSLGAVNGAIDVRNNAMIVDYAAGGASPLQAIAGLVSSRRIISSVGAAGTAVGYAEASAVLGSSGGAFAGQTVDASAVIVRYTVSGDATLDGRVNFDDLLVLAKHYNATGAAATWDAGDFDDTRTINFDDLLVLAKNYNGAVASVAAPAAASPAFAADWSAARAAAAAVPEPGGGAVLAAVLGLAWCGGTGRRVRCGRGRSA
jgi:autotransporter-associated beta strand protein